MVAYHQSLAEGGYLREFGVRALLLLITNPALIFHTSISALGVVDRLYLTPAHMNGVPV
jgi:hypothetical protein